MLHAIRRALRPAVPGGKPVPAAKYAAGAAALALLATPCAFDVTSAVAGADGRRLTLGANRATYEPAPMFPMPYAQLAAGPALAPMTRLVEPRPVASATPIDPLPGSPATPAKTAKAANQEVPAIRVLPPSTPPTRQAQVGTAKPDVKSEPLPSSATAEPRTEPHADRVVSSPTKASKTARASRPATKVVERDNPVRTARAAETRVKVEAPSTKVAVRDHKVRVEAPFTRISVDDGRVRVRAPFVNLDIRW
jgi:hypothetical protein